LKELEREEIASSYFGQESESALQLKEVAFLSEQLRNVAESDAFKAFEGASSALQKEALEDKFFQEKISKAVETILA
jgi:hypothetical protein